MRKIVTAATFLLITMVLVGSCSSQERQISSQKNTIDCAKIRRVNASESLVLELEWGTGEDQVGYTNERFRDFNKAWQGPCNMRVDPEGNVYIDDGMNLRFVKYGSDGSLLASVLKDKFTTNLDNPRSLQITCSRDCMILYTIGESVVQKYSFEKNELITLDLNTTSKMSGVFINDIIVDENDILYIFSRSEPDSPTSPLVLNKVDASLSKVLERRELPDQIRSISAVDTSGNLYFLDNAESDKSIQVIRQIDTTNSLHELLDLRKVKGSRLWLRKASGENKFLLVQSEDNGNESVLIVDKDEPFSYMIPRNPSHNDIQRDDSIYYDSIPFNNGSEDIMLSPYQVYRLAYQ
jgi:hypothetical protein